MTTEDDIKRDPQDPEAPLAESAAAESDPLRAASDLAALRDGSTDLAAEDSDDEDEADDDLDAPVQLGAQRFVFAAYFALGIAAAFMLSKALSYGWTRLSLWKPQLGEPHDEVVMPVAAVVGALLAFYYYRDEKTRTLAEEVASELGKVTWPNRDEVVNGTFVVVVTTFLATAFFALMDRFWGFVTNLVYGA